MLLRTAFTLMTNPFKDEFMQLPKSFTNLYRASLRAFFPIQEPAAMGLAAALPTQGSILDHFTLPASVGSTDPHPGEIAQASIACDGVHIYVQNSEMLFKVHAGLGYGLQGQVVAVAPNPSPYSPGTKVQLVCLAGTLMRFVYTPSVGGSLEIIDPLTLGVEATDEQVREKGCLSLRVYAFKTPTFARGVFFASYCGASQVPDTCPTLH